MFEEALAFERPGGWFQGFADLLAEEVQRELRLRGVPLLVSEGKVRPDRYEGRDFVGDDGIYQVSLLMKWPDNAEKIPATDFLSKYLKRWAIEMGLKLARPGVLSTFGMDFPRGLRYAAIGRADDLLLRCVVDYLVQRDTYVLRVDALAKWNEI